MFKSVSHTDTKLLSFVHDTLSPENWIHPLDATKCTYLRQKSVGVCKQDEPRRQLRKKDVA